MRNRCFPSRGRAARCLAGLLAALHAAAAPPTVAPAPGQQAAVQPVAPALPPTADQVFRKVAPSMVLVGTFDENDNLVGFGSGVVMGPGQVVTHCQVGAAGPYGMVRRGDRTYTARVRHADKERGLCELEVPGLDAPALRIHPLAKLRGGSRVFAIGAPRGLDPTVSAGTVLGIRTYAGATVIQTDAATPPGSSGGGLFDEDGQLVGIATFQLKQGRQQTLALPADWIGQIQARAAAAEARRSSEAVRSDDAQPEEPVGPLDGQVAPIADDKPMDDRMRELAPRTAVSSGAAESAESSGAPDGRSAAQPHSEVVLREAHESRILDGYKDHIRARIKANATLPPRLPTGLRVEIQLHLEPTGRVKPQGIRIASSSGNKAYDQAIVNAVVKSSPFPLPRDPSIRDKFRDVTLVFEHQR
jgi:TonB family protein